MLFPPDLKEWVADNDLARLILEAVEICDLRGARINERGSGSEQYPPSMMMAALIYCYANKLYSSRQIERATYDSVAVRYLCANHHPDHDTIATFRRENEKLFRGCFTQVLLMAREIGILQVGSVSIDGTRMAGAGSKAAVRSLSQIESELKQLAHQMIMSAEKADREDRTAGGMQMPQELADVRQRHKKLLAAREHLMGRREKARQAGKRDEPGSAVRSDRVSVSEPESRMQSRGAGASIQGYNAQACSDAGQSGLILGAHLSDAANDAGQIVPGLESLPKELEKPNAVLADSGYDAGADIARAEAKHGVLVLCPPQGRPRARTDIERPRTALWTRRRQMEARLQCPLLRAMYRRRQPSAEGVFARVKVQMGFDRFQCWGLKAASAEWQLLCLAHNCRQLSRRLGQKRRLN
jgi:transposase